MVPPLGITKLENPQLCVVDTLRDGPTHSARFLFTCFLPLVRTYNGLTRSLPLSWRLGQSTSNPTQTSAPQAFCSVESTYPLHYLRPKVVGMVFQSTGAPEAQTHIPDSCFKEHMRARDPTKHNPDNSLLFIHGCTLNPESDFPTFLAVRAFSASFLVQVPRAPAGTLRGQETHRQDCQ